MELIDRYFTPPGGSFFLFGPRGTGKSTWAKRCFPDAATVDLLDPETHRALSAAPERLREWVSATVSRTVVIDEIQKVPALLDLVHAMLEEHAGWRFVLTGSSARKLKRAGVDLLAGRALLCRLHPFMASELGDRFDIDTALRNGMLPVVHGARSPAQTLRAYASLYVREEVQLEGLTRNVGAFNRFLETISFSHGSVLNVNAVAREAEVQRKVAEAYIGILEDLMLAYRVPVFAKRAQRATTTHPKFYLFDAGVYRSLRASGPLDRPAEIAGPALEGLVAQHLRAWIDYGERDLQLHFWRTRAGLEVDFVLYGSEGITAIEVTGSTHLHPGDIRGLKAFREDYPAALLLLLHRGQRVFIRDGIHCLPCGAFLRELRPDGGLPTATDRGREA